MPKKGITASEVAVERIMENTRQDIERNQPAASKTELTHRVIEPLSRDDNRRIIPRTNI